ncbi:probable UDP-sugar transporter protein SLC35A5 [Salvelinus fontinalis]|uniref:probable UDP-sugar transporter protein SLC35A5 n=1 Tax=Salvelinus fontinalis TaxID=8038 RepID=UPI0024865EFC|nr:probable UDP-sugar transporter protein SLC35A5 [Salvelinus fontinalis]XP_055726315.1 probable UDP-sugar transporter protein SLC35A5 [Salvelinus fontinalis]XP_055726316.1 probable UDP-sugar transporter protein SLC35A5 [Salvelinus fontinalis]
MTCCRLCSRLCPRLCSRSSAYTLALGLGFVTLGTSRILLLKFSANTQNKYDFLPASVNLLAEGLKLLFCLGMSLRVMVREGRSCRELGCSSGSAFLSFMKWSVPAFLYFLDNLIIFYVMTYLQPAMAVLFSNFVILTTAILFRVVLKRRLSWVQWASLVILFLSIVSLTTGSGGSHRAIAMPGLHPSPLSPPTNSCLLYTQLEEQRRNESNSSTWSSVLPGQAEAWRGRLMGTLRSLGMGHILLVLQCFISSMANIYNEKILKEGDQLQESIFIQNSKLYMFGMLFNGLTLGLGGEARGLTVHCGLLYGHNVYSLGLVLVTAALGLSVAFILKFRDNMFHVLTGQITTVLVTALSLFLFDFHPSLDFFLQAPVVLLAIFVYNASRPKDPEYVLQREKLRVINGEVLQRSRGDGEELERLTKPNTDSESEEESV